VVDATELRAVALFGSLDDDELAALCSCSELLEVPTAGVDLTRQGDFGHSLYAVVGGTASVTVDGAPVRELAQGDVFGEIAVVSSGRRTATVTSTSPMRLVSVFKRDLWRLAEGNPRFGDALRQVTARE
jgi:CRP-like cAMP-binding protein